MSDHHTVNQRAKRTQRHNTRGHHLHIAKHENGQVLEGSAYYLCNTENGQRSFTTTAVQTTETNGRSVVFTMDTAETKHFGEGKQENVD